jgi:integrase
VPGGKHQQGVGPEGAKKLSDAEPASLVFPGREGKPLSNMVFLMTLRRMERHDITAHGFRSSFRDWASERTNTPQAVCEAALAHTVRAKTEAAYNRTDLFERRRKLMGAWAAFATAKPADVVSLHGECAACGRPLRGNVHDARRDDGRREG